MKKTIGVALILILPFLFVHLAFGQTEEPTAFIRAILEEAMAIQSDQKPAGQDARETRRVLIKKVIEKNFDIQGMAKSALGPAQWDALDQGQRSEFASIFQDLFLDSYSRLVLDFLKKEKMEYRGQEGGQGGVTVRTIIRRLDDSIPVDYLVLGQGKGWLVGDVTIDGVSIVGNYRTSFSRVIKQESYGALLSKMRIQQRAVQGEKQK